MKTQILSLAFFLVLFTSGFAQDEAPKRSTPIIYSGIVNSVPDGFNLPLIGFINMGWGTHYSAQVGFINFVKKDFTGTQIGFINTAGRAVMGTQIGYVNTAGKNVTGAQIGFVNTTGGNYIGPQIGFINTAVKNCKSIQLGFINTCADSLKGAQIGFVNTTTRRAEAGQIGYVNIAKNLKGVQLGFVNLVDTIESGVPIGFLSIVKKGGYHAVELSLNEMYPVNLAYKIGVSKLYTSLILSYNPSNQQGLAVGLGLGSVLPLGKKFSLIPEVSSQSTILNGWQQINTFALNGGFNINSHLTVLAGPSLVWQYGNLPEKLNKPFFSFSNNTYYNRGNLITGARVALRYKF